MELLGSRHAERVVGTRSRRILMSELAAVRWSEWFRWGDIASGRIRAPRRAGVYEVRPRDQEMRLTIGETNLLQRRVSYLVRGTGPHSAGERIRASEDVANVLVRWAVTERHEEVEQHLHGAHRDRFGRLPTHTRRTGRAARTTKAVRSHPASRSTAR